jgi:hypothetical protein
MQRSGAPAIERDHRAEPLGRTLHGFIMDLLKWRCLAIFRVHYRWQIAPMKTHLLAAMLLTVVIQPASLRAESQRPTAAPHDGQHDFDFMFGRWKIQLRRLLHPLHGSHEWYEMTGTTVCHPIWGGQANIEEVENDGPHGHMSALMVRLYSPASRQWSLNWVNKQNARFDVPTIGEFKDGRGEFYDQELFEGRAILVRYIWSDITATSAHFEQAFSADGGKSWEVNWIAQSTRLE